MSSPRPTMTRPRGSRSSAPADLLITARRGLLEATLAETAEQRYAAAHLAALRAAAAVLAARARPRSHRSGPRSVWALLANIAPELGEWAQFFAAGSAKRSLAAAGISVVSSREADDLLRDAELFCDRVTAMLSASAVPGIDCAAAQPILPATG